MFRCGWSNAVGRKLIDAFQLQQSMYIENRNADWVASSDNSASGGESTERHKHLKRFHTDAAIPGKPG